MTKILLALALVAGCGSDHVVFVYPEMSTPDPEDMSAAVMSMPDLATTSADLFEACTRPTPGVYFDFNAFTYSSVANPNPTTGAINLTVIVRNSGVFERPADNMTPPSFFHCDTPPAIDPSTCLAPCCGGDPIVVPSIYYFGQGWRLFKAGTCTFKDPTSSVVYSVQFTGITGQPQ
jgi:hypothetical protein